jgi:hypothetical protein
MSYKVRVPARWVNVTVVIREWVTEALYKWRKMLELAQFHFILSEAVIPKRGVLQPRLGSPIIRSEGDASLRLKNGYGQHDA